MSLALSAVFTLDFACKVYEDYYFKSTRYNNEALLPTIPPEHLLFSDGTGFPEKWNEVILILMTKILCTYILCIVFCLQYEYEIQVLPEPQMLTGASGPQDPESGTNVEEVRILF